MSNNRQNMIKFIHNHPLKPCKIQVCQQRMARGSGSRSRSGSFEVESEAPEGPGMNDRLARAELTKTLMQSMNRWFSTHDPDKRMCKDVIDASSARFRNATQ